MYMTINIYWACLEDQWMLASQPEPVIDLFHNKNLIGSEPLSKINYCPSFNANMKNLFALRSIFDYEFYIDEDRVISNMYDQEFFDNHVVIRSIEKKFFSFRNKYIFFTDNKSLDVTFYEYPFFEENNITERCLIPQGKFDIGRWFRNTEFAFYLKSKFNAFKIEQNEIYSYIRFHTDKDIKFIQFRYTDKLASYQDDGFALTKYSNLRNLNKYYSSFKNKKLILEEIERNII